MKCCARPPRAETVLFPDSGGRGASDAWFLTVFALSLLMLASPALAFSLFGSDQRWQEGEYSLPAPPHTENLRPFYVNATTSNRFMLDGHALSVGKDGVVRYTLVITTPGGALNLSHEGIRCASSEYRIYGIGHGDNAWRTPRNSDEWRPVADNSAGGARAVLKQEYFCDGSSAPQDREALQRQMEKAWQRVPKGAAP